MWNILKKNRMLLYGWAFFILMWNPGTYFLCTQYNLPPVVNILFILAVFMFPIFNIANLFLARKIEFGFWKLLAIASLGFLIVYIAGYISINMFFINYSNQDFPIIFSLFASALFWFILIFKSNFFIQMTKEQKIHVFLFPVNIIVAFFWLIYMLELYIKLKGPGNWP